MDSKELLTSITSQFYNDSKAHITYLALSERLMHEYKDLLEDDVQVIDLKSINSPLKPFLDIASSLNPSKKLLKENTYQLQYETFASFFKNQNADERGDAVIIEEIGYEKIRIRQTIVNLIAKTFTGKIVVFNMQLMGECALDILQELEKTDFKGKFTFCFDSLKLDEPQNEVKQFIQQIRNNSNFYSISVLSDLDAGSFCVVPTRTRTFKDVYWRLRNARLFLDLNEAYRFIKQIDSSNLLINFDLNEVRQIHYEMGLICFYNDDMDMATFYLDAVIENQIDDDLETAALLYLAQVSCRKNMNSVALRYISKAISKLKKTPENPLYSLCMMIDYIITERTDSQYSTEKYSNVLSLLDSQGFYNNRIYTTLIVPYGVVYQEKLRRQMLVKVQEAKDAAEKLQNKFGLSTACHWLGILLTHEGRKSEAMEWYNKSLALRQEIGEVSSITKITNGLSYEYLVDSNYKQSYEIINGFIHGLLSTKDYPEAIITLYNVARTLFYARNFEAAYGIFQSITNLMLIFDLHDFSITPFMPEYNDLIVYTSIIDYYKNDITRAKINLHNVMNNGRRVTEIEGSLKIFLKAIVELADGDISSSEKTLEEAQKLFADVGKSQEHRMAFMLYEYAFLLDKNGYKEKSESVLKNAFEYAKKYNLPYYTKSKNSITLKEYLNAVETFPPLDLDLALLEERAEKERLVNQLHKRLRDSQFLNKLVTTNVNNLNDIRFANNIAQSIFDYTMAEAVFLAEKTEGNWVPLATSTRDEFPTPSGVQWDSVISSVKTVEIMPHPQEEDRFIVAVNLSKFEFVGALLIYLQKKTTLSSEEISILNIAASSIQAQLVMLKQNEHLTIISSTDQLSMLNNRRALQEHLGLESEMIRRYEKKRQLYMHEAISFIDLDNFKYYNDTFGHEAGDLLIACFAKLLKSIYRKVDFVARFGGDEFVVVLPNTTCPEANRAAERLQEALEKAQHFVPDLERLLGKKLEIAPERLLGFSMGICSNADGTDFSDLEQTMVNADHALYYSKQHKKGSVTIWTDVKEKLASEVSLPTRTVNLVEK